jgi:N-acetylglucosaminyl-diphospho-decaprenol L-rhamnosyltransferase
VSEYRSGTSPRAQADIAVIVVTHNSARHLESLGRALAEGSVLPARMLVVDNESLDDTVMRARSAGFEVLETGSNRGFGAGCNAGLHAVANEFVLFCNPDASPAPDALERLLDALARTPAAAIAGAAFGEAFQARKFARITGHIVGFLPARLSRSRPLRRFERRIEVDETRDQIVVDYAVGAFILCRTAALRLVGGFDESFFLYFEEADLAHRLGDRGWQTLLVPAACVAHEHNASSTGMDGPKMTPFRIHSAYLYYRKHHSRAYAEVARCVLATGVALDRCYRALAGRAQVYGPGTVAAPFKSIDTIRRDSAKAAHKDHVAQ